MVRIDKFVCARSQVGNVLIIPLVTVDLLCNLAAPYKITMVIKLPNRLGQLE
jgi:hypothetical protein